MSKTTLPFGRIDSITLDMALPGVFAGQEKEGHVALSEVWMHSLTFSRPGRYMIEAESGAGKSSLCSFIYGNRSDYLGHILFNDARYGGHEILKGTHFAKYRQFVNNCFDTCPRQALHAMTLGFRHPVTGEEMDFTSPLPDDMARLIEKWRSYISNRETL